MFLAMNRFQVLAGQEQTFVDIWRNRNSYLDEVPGFETFNLLRGSTENGITLFSSHSQWASRQAFEDWTRSDAFRKAHAGAGKTTEGIYAGPAKLELFESII